MNNEMNANVIDIEPEVEKKDLCDKVLDTVIAIGEEIKAHPVKTAAVLIFGRICYKKGKKKGKRDGYIFAVDKFREITMYVDEDTNEKWNLLEAITHHRAEAIQIFSDDQMDEYECCHTARAEFRKNKAKSSD